MADFPNFENVEIYQTSMTSKDIAFLIDTGGFLEYIGVQIFIPMTLAITAIFTFQSTNFVKLLGG